jgi:hypothetical protein
MNVPVTALTLPIGFCPVTYQDIWNAFATASQVEIPDALSQIIWQTTQPSDQTVSWGKLDAQGFPIGIYRFAQGSWLLRHPSVPGLTQWWFNALPDFTSFDGGDANSNITPTTGAMWQQALDGSGNIIAAQFPITAGILPSGTVLSVGGTGGEENHTLLTSEMPSHVHSFPTPYWGVVVSGGAAGTFTGSDMVISNAATGATGGSSASGNPTVPHNNLPPFIVGFLLQRTARQFYVG